MIRLNNNGSREEIEELEINEIPYSKTSTVFNKGKRNWILKKSKTQYARSNFVLYKFKYGNPNDLFNEMKSHGAIKKALFEKNQNLIFVNLQQKSSGKFWNEFANFFQSKYKFKVACWDPQFTKLNGVGNYDYFDLSNEVTGYKRPGMERYDEDGIEVAPAKQLKSLISMSATSFKSGLMENIERIDQVLDRMNQENYKVLNGYEPILMDENKSVILTWELMVFKKNEIPINGVLDNQFDEDNIRVKTE